LLAFAIGPSCNLPGPEGNAVYLQNGAVRIVDQGNLAGQTPCSEGRGGLDRWCVFFKQKQTETRGQDVWAVNVSRIGRGENVQCNQPGPACVSLATGDHVVHWGFVADTLIIDGVPAGTSAANLMPTPVTAWRPDWASPVTVTSEPVSACWTDATTESVACVEPGAASDASANDAGTFYAGRLTQTQHSLTVVPQGREAVQALTTSDCLLVWLSPSGAARVHLGSGTVEVLPAEITSAFNVTPDEKWFLWSIGQKSDLTGTHSLVATAFPQGGARHVLLGDVARHHFVQGPRAAGADVVAITTSTDGADNLMLTGPDSNGTSLSTDLGAWMGTTTSTLDATSADGFAVVADTQGTAVVPLLASGEPCFFGTSVIPSSQIVMVPSLDSALWVDAAAGVAGIGYRRTLATCAKAVKFAASAMALEVESENHLLYLDSAKDLYRLDLSVAGAVPTSMRDPDEVVYRWAYAAADDVLLLEMTSSFDTAIRLYALRNPFP
jgi:hypothetical protein